MNCPHCGVAFWDNTPNNIPIGVDSDGGWSLIVVKCPACRRFVMTLRTGKPVKPIDIFAQPIYSAWQIGELKSLKDRIVHPKTATRQPISPSVPQDIAEDYLEACLVFQDSPKASAALSRRCLQNLLRQYASVNPGNLASEIQQVLDSKRLPSHLAESIDAVRHIGNFAAHPNKSNQSGDIMPVEPGEAEWSLDVLEGLFDFFFVQPQVMAQKKAALAAKLAETGNAKIK